MWREDETEEGFDLTPRHPRPRDLSIWRFPSVFSAMYFPDMYSSPLLYFSFNILTPLWESMLFYVEEWWANFNLPWFGLFVSSKIFCIFPRVLRGSASRPCWFTRHWVERRGSNGTPLLNGSSGAILPAYLATRIMVGFICVWLIHERLSAHHIFTTQPLHSADH